MTDMAVMPSWYGVVTQARQPPLPSRDGATPHGALVMASMMVVAVFWMRSSDSVSISLSPL